MTVSLLASLLLASTPAQAAGIPMDWSSDPVGQTAGSLQDSKLAVAERIARSTHERRESQRLAAAIACVEYGIDCPKEREGRGAVYDRIVREVTRVIGSMNSTDVESDRAMSLMRKATNFALADVVSR